MEVWNFLFGFDLFSFLFTCCCYHPLSLCSHLGKSKLLGCINSNVLRIHLHWFILLSSLRSGSKAANWELYPKALQELGRVCRPQLARGVLLTHDHRALSRVGRAHGRSSFSSCYK